MPVEAVLDGELVVLDELGRPRFELMQRHEYARSRSTSSTSCSSNGHDTIELPYEQRRALLDSLLETGAELAGAGTSGSAAAPSCSALTAAQGSKGVMAKRLGSTYVPGKRSPNWRKVKNRIRAEVVIGGFTAGTGNRASTFGALLVGVRDRRRIGCASPAGSGTGFDQATLERLHGRLAARRDAGDCPFEPAPPREYQRGATWVSPSSRPTIELTEWTNEGLVRHASFVERGLEHCEQGAGAQLARREPEPRARLCLCSMKSTST